MFKKILSIIIFLLSFHTAVSAQQLNSNFIDNFLRKLIWSYCDSSQSLKSILEAKGNVRTIYLSEPIKIDNKIFYDFEFKQYKEMILYSFKQKEVGQEEFIGIKAYLEKNRLFHIDLFYDAYLTGKSDIYDLYCIFDNHVLEVRSRPACRPYPINQIENFQSNEYPIYEKLIDTIFRM